MKNILIYDLHASESGALSILMGLYNEIAKSNNENIHWHFIVSTPQLKPFPHITIYNYPWVKKSWFHRLFFEFFYEKRMIRKISPDMLLSLQNLGVNNYNGKQLVYLHLALMLVDYRFKVKRDGVKLWFYQNIIKYLIWRSYKKVDLIIVQTEWMKKALASVAKINLAKIQVISPKISIKNISRYRDNLDSRKVFFYPATAFAYKNHFLILEACKLLKEQGICNFRVIFTLKKNGDITDYERKLVSFVSKNNLDNVEFCGLINRERVFDLYSQSILLFPSLIESFGMPLLEARLSGCIILSAKTPFADEILAGYENGYFYEGDDYRHLSSLMQDVMCGKTIYHNNYVGMIERPNEKTLVDILTDL